LCDSGAVFTGAKAEVNRVLTSCFIAFFRSNQYPLVTLKNALEIFLKNAKQFPDKIRGKSKTPRP